MDGVARMSVKTCNRCGRTGSHAFRRTSDGLHECTTATACRARTRRLAGIRHDGRGRLPRQGSAASASPGVAYVIGTQSGARAAVEDTLRNETGLLLAVGEPNRSSLSALGSRNVRLIAVEARCLISVGFRNEFVLRCRQPRLAAVPVFVFGSDLPGPMSMQLPQVVVLSSGLDGIGPDLRRRLAALPASWAGRAVNSGNEQDVVTS
jgi:hypothetical protein